MQPLLQLVSVYKAGLTEREGFRRLQYTRNHGQARERRVCVLTHVTSRKHASIETGGSHARTQTHWKKKLPNVLHPHRKKIPLEIPPQLLWSRSSRRPRYLVKIPFSSVFLRYVQRVPIIGLFGGREDRRMTVQQPSLRRLVISSSMLCCQPAAFMRLLARTQCPRRSVRAR